MTITLSTRTLGVVAVIALAGSLLAGCKSGPSLPHLNSPFARHQTEAQRAARHPERVSLLELNDQLRVSDALKGQDFFLPEAQPMASWPLPGGTPEQSVENVAAAPDFTVAWRRNFGRGSNKAHHVTSPPIMADGKVFVMDGQAEVSAHDAATGAQLWRTNLEPKSKRDREAFGGGLAYADGKVYATSGFRLVAQIDAATGKVGWVTRTESPMHAAPTVSAGLVYSVDVDDELRTFEVGAGVAGWTYQGLTEPARILAASSPAVTGDTLVASFASGELVAMRASNGTELWNQGLSRANRNNALSEIRDIAGRPVIYKGDVFAVSHSYVMAATDLRTGASRWTLPISAITTPWAAGDVVYVVDVAGQVICISRQSGQVYWIHDLNAGRKKDKRAIWSSPLLSNGRLVIVSSKGEAVALNAKTGALQHSLKLGSDALIGPIAAGNMIYVVTDKAELVAIR